MEAYITDKWGGKSALPLLLEWEFIHSLDSCDGFTVKMPLVSGLAPKLERALVFDAYHDGKTVFRGLVDEYELIADEKGAFALLTGRGYGALLLDNEAESAEYWSPAMQQILDNHIYPFGIGRVKYKNMECSGRFPVSSGQSQWKVLRDFCYFAAGIEPWFDREGQLILDGSAGEKIRFQQGAISAQCCREKHYGVFSQVLVKNTAAGVSTLVENPNALGLCRRVVTMPRYTQYDSMRHTGEYQIHQSEKGSKTMLITLPIAFAAFAGDRVELVDSPLGISGNFTVRESRCVATGKAAYTRLELVREE